MTSKRQLDTTGFRRLMLTVALVSLVATVVVVVLGLRAVSRAGETLADSLDLTAQAVGAVDETLVIAAEAVETVASGLDSAAEVVAESESALDGAGRLLSNTGVALREDVPASVDAIRSTMPALIQSAEFLESALSALTVLGVDFDPPIPPADSLRTVESGLAGIADRLRSTAGDLGELGGGLDDLSTTTGALGAELARLEASLSQADQLLDGYTATTRRTAMLVDAASADLDAQRREAQFIVLLLGLIVGLGQAVPLALAWQSARQPHQESVATFEAAAARVGTGPKEETQS